jgi:hypothetical protein
MSWRVVCADRVGVGFTGHLPTMLARVKITLAVSLGLALVAPGGTTDAHGAVAHRWVLSIAESRLVKNPVAVVAVAHPGFLPGAQGAKPMAWSLRPRGLRSATSRRAYA